MSPFGYATDPLCLLACALYAINRWLVAPHVTGAFWRGQFGDLLLIPAALPPVLWIQRRLRLRHHDQPPCWSEIGLHLVVWSILFEVIGPRIAAVTGDPLDVLAYGVGGALAGLWWQRSRVRSRPPA